MARDWTGLTDLLPPGAVLTEVARADGKPAVNVRTAAWQVAVPLTADTEADETRVLAAAWEQQARHEHHQRMVALNTRLQAEIRQLDDQFRADVEDKIQKAKQQHQEKKHARNSGE